MKLKITITLLLVCIGLLITPVASENLQVVSITEDNNQFMAVTANKDISYSYESNIPDNGKMVLTVGSNDTYLVETTDSIKFITVNNKKSNGINIINILIGWL